MDDTATDAATAAPTPDVAFDVEISNYDAPAASESSCGGVTQPILVSVPWTDGFAAATRHLVAAAAEASGRDPSDLAVCSYPEGEAWTEAVWDDDKDSWTHVAQRVYAAEPDAEERHRLLTKVHSRRIRVDDAACVRARAALAADGHAVDEPDAALRDAVAAGDAALARRWLAAGVGADVPGPYRRRPLAAAAHASPDPATVALLLESGADVGAKEMSGATALHWAAHEGRLENVRVLLAAGASAEACTHEGESPLQYAVLNKHDAVAGHLLAVGGALLEKPRNNPAGQRLAEAYTRLNRSCAPGDALWLALNPGKTPPTPAELLRMQRERALEAAVAAEDFTEAARLKQLIRATEKEALAEAAKLQTGSEEGTSGSWTGFLQSVETLTMTGPASSGGTEGVVVSSECLGRGSFGSVYKGYDLASGEHVAVKRICNLAPAKMDKINREVLIMGKLRHPNVVRYLGSALNDAVPYLDIYMELMVSSLQDLIEKIHADDARLENIVCETQVIGRQVLSGLVHLHDENVAHRDIKPANILVSSSGDLKLSDFGAAKEYHSVGMTRTETTHPVGTVAYMAPELLTRARDAADDDEDPAPSFLARKRTDLWSVGCTVLSTYTSRLPFHEVRGDWMALLMHLSSDRDAHPVFPDDAPELLLDLFARLMCRNPSDRLTARQALEHPFFAGTLSD